MVSMEDFEDFYENNLKAVIGDFENRRKGIVKKLFTAGGISTLLTIPLGLLIASKYGSAAPLIFSAVVDGLIIALFWWLLTRGFVYEFKMGVIAPIVTFCDESLSYRPEGSVSVSTFQQSQIFKSRIDRYKGEDLVEGTIGKTALEFSEIHAEKKTETRDKDGKTQTQWHTIFKGLFFAIDFNKDFKGCTVVLPDTAQKLFGFLGQKLQGMNMMRGELVKMEDPEFEKEFVVYGEDQIEARYILSPALMKRITDFKKKSGCKIFLSFVASTMFIAIDTKKNLFEPKLFSRMDDISLAKEYLEDLVLAVGIVEDMNLNTRIWSKD